MRWNHSSRKKKNTTLSHTRIDAMQGCGAQIEITVNGKPVVEDVTVISEGCDVEEYLKVGIAAMVVVGDRPTLLQLVRKVRRMVGWVT